jgi:uncharacterized protein YcbX
MHLASLHIYPFKSLRAISLEEARLDELGLENDRRFLIVDEAGRAITQRSDPTLALIATALKDGQLVLSGPGLRPLSVPLAPDPSAELRSVEVWRASGMLAEDCGAESTRWFSAFLGRTARLVRIGNAFSRPIPTRKVPATLPFHEPATLTAPAVHASLGVDTATHHRVSFADAVPLLVIAQASLADLNARLITAGGVALPMDRFRPNLVLAGALPYEEDSLGRFRVGDVILHAAGGCSRCIMTTTDQATGERGTEPLRTLAAYRRDPQKPADVLFGQNVIHETKSGLLRIGDTVERL